MRDGQKTQMARRLRRAGNAPEKAAWKALRALRHHGLAVRRQHPIGPYIVDFAIVSRKLIIEVDGDIHRLPHVAAADAARATFLRAAGWQLIRVLPETALSEHHLLAHLQELLGGPKDDAPSPPTPLPPAGEGG